MTPLYVCLEGSRGEYTVAEKAAVAVEVRRSGPVILDSPSESTGLADTAGISSTSF